MSSVRAATFGNRCGHKVDFCRAYERKATHKKPPPIITAASHAVVDFFFHPTKYLDKLNFLTGKYRQKKSERRESIAGVLGMLVNYCHLTSLAVGTYHKDGSVNNLSTGCIAAALKFGVKRVYRALKDLAKAGYIEIIFRVVNTKYGLKQSNSIKLTRQCFLDLKLPNIFCEISAHYKRNSDTKSGKFTPYQSYASPERGTLAPLIKKVLPPLPDHLVSMVKSGNRLEAMMSILSGKSKKPPS